MAVVAAHNASVLNFNRAAAATVTIAARLRLRFLRHNSDSIFCFQQPRPITPGDVWPEIVLQWQLLRIQRRPLTKARKLTI